MKVHQVIWSSERRDVLQFRTLSCFECILEEPCSHYFLTDVNYGEQIHHEISNGNIFLTRSIFFTNYTK